MRRWLLPESIEDVLPAEARRIERLRRLMLDAFARAGYELVMPPLLEYLDSLLTGTGRDLDLRTFKLVDQISGKTMGVRADITPQVARIDAHLLNREGVVRLCYCGSVLHTLPASLTATREPLQIGAELYGHVGLEADVEVIRLLARALDLAEIKVSRIDLGHVGLFKALMRMANVDVELEMELFQALQAKDLPELAALTAGLVEPVRSAILGLTGLYGDRAVLARAHRQMPRNSAMEHALTELRRLSGDLPDLPVSFDLADLRGYHYHSGVVFAAYCEGYPGALALGGRYDEVGRAFGRGRPATGFSMDLREAARLAPPPPPTAPIIAPYDSDPALRQRIDALRSRGEIVIVALPGHDVDEQDSARQRRLVARDGGWRVREISEGD